ncbi:MULTISPECIES: glycosyltransferase family 2 protein [unclassified Novosphingobium]|uniref:glycosyltransferase family 2 protein n=1 Tax=unclassified Novosphingobium TaxID=2644732 RepID=UPI00135692D7|nr:MULTISPECIES: glycosyltransferase family 2 protein [unclassified Novosphingobium]
MERQQRPTLMVVIVNYRTGKLVVDCLASLDNEVAASPGTRVVVVDNDSRDGSADTIEAAIEARGWSDWSSLVRSPVNGGFAAGNNLAIRAALADAAAPDLFWLLNPDTRVHPGALSTFLDFFEANPTVGIAGNLLLYGNEMPWPFAFRFPSILSELERGAAFGPLTKLLQNHCVARVMGTAPEQVDSVSGASMVVRRATLYATGLMDEGYFLYYEETDFCRRARQQGWSCWYLPSAVVLHIAGQSTGLKDNQASRIPRYWFDSRRRYFIVNHGKGYAIIADIAWLAGHVWWRVLRRLRTRKETVVPFLLRDFIARSALFNDAQALPGRA